VVWNLLSNAVKFTPHQGQVEVRLDAIETVAQIQVIDTGKGIHASFIPYVFDYFRQADSSMTRSTGGLGLGLAISRYLVELHGGTIEVASDGDGKGATFTVRLPVQSSEPERFITSSNPVATETLLQSKQILVAGATDDIRDLIVAVLEQVGAEVTTVVSTGAVLEELARAQPDLLISTIELLQENDYELAQRLRLWTQEFGEAIPVIVLAADPEDIDIQEMLTTQIQWVLSRSAEPAELIEAIAQLIHPKA
jgi:hypothetical protein